jgi:hypothetical protein
VLHDRLAREVQDAIDIMFHDNPRQGIKIEQIANDLRAIFQGLFHEIIIGNNFTFKREYLVRAAEIPAGMASYKTSSAGNE